MGTILVIALVLIFYAFGCDKKLARNTDYTADLDSGRGGDSGTMIVLDINNNDSLDVDIDQ